MEVRGRELMLGMPVLPPAKRRRIEQAEEAMEEEDADSNQMNIDIDQFVHWALVTFH